MARNTIAEVGPTGKIVLATLTVIRHHGLLDAAKKVGARL